MARLTVEETYPQPVNRAYSWWRVALLGAALGVVYWTLTVLLGQYVAEPLYCGASLAASACVNSVNLAGDIAAIIVAVIGLIVLVRMHVLRPIVVVVATMIALWGLSGWTKGLNWGEIVFWCALLYGTSYVLFSWISRYIKTIPVLLGIGVIVAVARIVALP